MQHPRPTFNLPAEGHKQLALLVKNACGNVVRFRNMNLVVAFIAETIHSDAVTFHVLLNVTHTEIEREKKMN